MNSSGSFLALCISIGEIELFEVGSCAVIDSHEIAFAGGKLAKW